MNRKRGFTLIELLVVMAIIAILAAIVVPNVAAWIDRARVTRAQSEIESIELALTKLLTDSARANTNQLFFGNAVQDFINEGLAADGTPAGAFDNDPPVQVLNTEQFAAAQQVYTRVLYALLRDGRDAFNATDPVLNNQPYSAFVDETVRKNIGTSYLPELTTDPFGQLYNIFPGPWPRSSVDGDGRILNPVPFRTYAKSSVETGLPGAARSNVDGLEYNLSEIISGEDEVLGFPAPRDKVAFIHSVGANLVSGQLVYQGAAGSASNPVSAYQGNARNFYLPQDEEFKGGGDDINNWDAGTSWTRFYN